MTQATTANSDARSKTPDVGSRQIAMTYAKALLGAAQSAGQVDQVMDDLKAIVEEVLGRFPDFKTILDSSLVSEDDKSGMLDRVFGGKLSGVTMNFLKVVANRGRADTLGEIHRAALDLYDELKGRVRVLVTTATPLTDPLRGQIADRMRTQLGREPVLEEAVDPRMIGGLLVRVGDQVFDSSVANQLEQLRTQMINRSVHEIQSRRDRFRHPVGN
jgi:F-type H+-transporting ATPase subunit delta